MCKSDMRKSIVHKSAVGAGIAALGLVSSVLLSAPAQAFSISISPTVRSTENTGATANLDFNFLQQGSDVLLNLGITNTTNGTAGLGATQATLVGVGFDLPANLGFSYDANGSTFTNRHSAG
jgi:hypothetical protein